MNKDNSSNNINLKSTFKSYENEKFAKLMEMDNIKPQDMMKSLSLEDNRNMVF